jgi:hypothetical protein
MSALRRIRARLAALYALSRTEANLFTAQMYQGWRQP